MNAQFSEALNNFESKLNALLAAITSPTASGAPAAAAALLEADDGVSAALDTLRTHQANYEKILRLRAEAERLEERIKTIVRDITSLGQQITEFTGRDDDDDISDDTDTDTESVDETSDPAQVKSRKHPNDGKLKEVDYRLLLDFARRISKYNKQAAADAAAGAGAQPLEKPQRDGDTEMADVDGKEVAQKASEAPVAAVTKQAADWLEESADQARQVFMIPYPSEDRIRLGVLGQLYQSAVENPNLDPEKEVERMVREAEGISAPLGVSVEKPGIQPGPLDNTPQTAAAAAAHVGSTVAGVDHPGAVSRPSAPPERPKTTLDLDLYDPDADD
ncbi:hypothetical protein VTN31DRAFT_162 [Thermomyces dupontii]|uniref:uncharacterized protein n=1 Tax=Talaromyces thermophilus TaxID=28565 RepID=UPI0037444FE8